MVRQATATAVSASISTPVWPDDFYARSNLDAGEFRVGFKIDGDLGQRERMAKRNKLVGAFGGHDAGDACGREHIAFLGIAFAHDLERGALHDDAAFGQRLTFGGGF